MATRFCSAIPPLSPNLTIRKSCLRQRILRGRIVLDNDDDELRSDISKDAVEETFVVESEDEIDRRKMLLMKRDLMRKKQREERRNRPDFNIVTDIAPDPDFDFSTDLSHTFSSTSNASITENLPSSEMVPQDLSTHHSLNDKSTSKLIFNEDESSKTLAETTRTLFRTHLTPKQEEIKANCGTVNVQEETDKKEVTVFENTKSTFTASQNLNEDIENGTASLVKRKDLSKSLANVGDSDFEACSSMSNVGNKNSVVLDSSDMVFKKDRDSNQQNKTFSPTHTTVIMHSLADDSLTSHTASKLGPNACKVFSPETLFKSNVVEEPNRSVLHSDLSVNGSPGLSAIAYDHTAAENSLLDGTQQNNSLNKICFNSTRDRLLNALSCGKHSSHVKATSKTLLSFKTPQRSSRLTSRQKNFSFQSTTIRNYSEAKEKVTRMTSTPMGSPDQHNVCNRYEDHHRKFISSGEARRATEESGRKAVNIPRPIKEKEDEMISLSPSTRILKSKFKKANEPAGSPFRVPRTVRPSIALQNIANYDGSDISSSSVNSSRTSKTFIATKETGASIVADAPSEISDIDGLTKENTINSKVTFAPEETAVASNNIDNIFDAGNRNFLSSLNELESLEQSAQHLSLEDDFKSTVIIDSNEVTSCVTKGKCDKKDSTYRSPVRQGLDLSILTVGTPGLESWSSRKIDRFSTVASISSPSMDESVVSVHSNDSAVSFLPLNIEAEKPFHLVSHYKRTATPEMILAKRRVMHPEESVGGVRRSQRNRVKPLRRWLGEEPVYRKDDQGNLELVDVTSVKINDPLLRKYKSASMADAVEKQRRKQKVAKIERQMKRKWGRRVTNS